MKINIMVEESTENPISQLTEVETKNLKIKILKKEKFKLH